ncbi:hypothetical protein ANN_23425 [Periplaneta americana]|uniref:Ig-like domain-containing protein n=1 Tax=Periplaneta americana TaxID=6978 RepID=A0ABQ8SLY8_PERAM|nr:hypothetical protein ANN_23425 [Periplaneta americana]
MSNWKHHLKRMSNSRLPKEIYDYVPYGQRSVGRPAKRWRENFMCDRNRPCGLTLVRQKKKKKKKIITSTFLLEKKVVQLCVEYFIADVEITNLHKQAKRDEVTGEWRKLHNTELHALYSSPDIIRNIKSRRLRWAGHVARMGESRNAYRVLVGRPEGKRPLGRPRRRWEDNIKMDLREVGYDDRDWINLAQDRDRWRAYVRAAMNLRVGWVKADTKAIQAIHDHVITHNPRVSVSHNDFSTWNLHVKNVQEEDRGMYMCQINTDPMKSQRSRDWMFENKVLRKIFGAKRDEVTGEWRKLHNAELHALYRSPDIIRNIKSRRLRWARHVARMGEFSWKTGGIRPLGRLRRRWEYNIKMNSREDGYDRDWINLAQDSDQ